MRLCVRVKVNLAEGFFGPGMPGLMPGSHVVTHMPRGWRVSWRRSGWSGCWRGCPLRGQGGCGGPLGTSCSRGIWTDIEVFFQRRLKHCLPLAPSLDVVLVLHPQHTVPMLERVRCVYCRVDRTGDVERQSLSHVVAIEGIAHTAKLHSNQVAESHDERIVRWVGCFEPCVQSLHLFAQYLEVPVGGRPGSRTKCELNIVHRLHVPKPEVGASAVANAILRELGEEGFDELTLEPFRHHLSGCRNDTTPASHVGWQPGVAPPIHRGVA